MFFNPHFTPRKVLKYSIDSRYSYLRVKILEVNIIALLHTNEFMTSSYNSLSLNSLLTTTDEL